MKEINTTCSAKTQHCVLKKEQLYIMLLLMPQGKNMYGLFTVIDSFFSPKLKFEFV